MSKKYEEKRAKYEEDTERKEGGPQPSAPGPGPRETDQVNLTHKESCIMHTSGGAFEQCYNAQAGVDNDSPLILTQYVAQNGKDTLEIAPTLEELARLDDRWGKPRTMIADAGYFSAANVIACAIQKIKLLISPSREQHPVPFWERFTVTPMKGAQTKQEEAALFSRPWSR